MRVRAERPSGFSLAGNIEVRESASLRLRRGLAEAGLDCDCREKANAVLDSFDAELELQRRAQALADARKMRDAIVIVLALLGEVDEITPDEPDASAFAELAGLFADAADFASSGADALRQIAAGATPITYGARPDRK